MIAAFAEDDAWAAFARRDRTWDGRLIGAVKTTGIYCRPSCPARRPKRENVEFFADPAAAQAAGYRACRRCEPDELRGGSPAENAEVIRQVFAGTRCSRTTRP